MRHTKQQPASRPRPLLLASLSLIGTLIVVLIVVASQRPAPPAPTSHFVELSPDSASRVVVVAAADQALPHRSASEKLLMTSLFSGQLPSGATRATVRTDSNCQPDQEGVSHCLNELAIGSATVVVRHHHKMSEVSCLTPGETVTILSLEQYKQL